MNIENKTVGFAMPFNTIDKEGRIDNNDLSKRYKYKPKSNINDIKLHVAQLKRKRERERLRDIFEAKLRYEKSRKYIKKEHERLVQLKNGREYPFFTNQNSPYGNPLDSERDHLYLIIPTDPKKMRRDKSNNISNFLNSEPSLNEELMSVSSIKNNYQNFNPSVSDSVGRLRNNKTISLNKKRERSKRLYNRNSDIYLPDISKDLKNNRGKSMMNLYDDTTPSKLKVNIFTCL